MVRRLRLLSLLLVLLLPLQGLANLLPPASCMMMASATGGSQQLQPNPETLALHAAHHGHRADCCADPCEPGPGEHSCKIGKGCLSAQVIALTASAPVLVWFQEPIPRLTLASGPNGLRPDAIWRPPSEFL